MTVPKSERTEAQSEFVIQSMRVLATIEALYRRLPKRWKDNAGDDIYTVAKRIAYNCVKANSVYAASVPEYDLRLTLLNDAYTDCHYLSLRVAQLYRLKPVQRYTETMPDGSIEQVEKQCISEKKVKAISESINTLQGQLRGQIKTFREKRKEALAAEQVLAS